MVPDSEPAATPELPEGYALRDWQASDLADVAALDALIFPHDAWSPALLKEEFQASRAPDPDRFYRVITDPTDAVIGYAGLLVGLPFADIQTIGVHPDHAGRGLGRALLTWLISQARTARAEDLLLEVRAANHRAQALYSAAGFEHIHTRAKYYPGGEDAKIFRLRLRAPRPSSAANLRTTTPENLE